MIVFKEILLGIIITSLIILPTGSFLSEESDQPLPQTLYLKSFEGRLDETISIRGIISEAQVHDASNQRIVSHAPLLIETEFPLNFFEVNKMELVDGLWKMADYMPVVGPVILIYSNNDGGMDYEEIIIEEGNSFDFASFEEVNPHLVLHSSRYGAGSYCLLEEKGIYQLSVSGPGFMPDNVLCKIIIK